MKQIPIILCADAESIMPYSVLVASVVANANPETAYEFCMMATPDVPQSDLNSIGASLATMRHTWQVVRPGLQVEGMDLNVRDWMGCSCTAALYPLLIASLFPQYEKAIFLWHPLLVRKDLAPLFDFALNGNYIAACPLHATSNMKEVYLQMDDLERTAHTHVELMNLAKMRADNCPEQFKNYLQKQNVAWFAMTTGIIFNALFKDHIAFLPPEYNWQVNFNSGTDGDPTIVCFPYQKFWEYPLPFIEEWRSYAQAPLPQLTLEEAKLDLFKQAEGVSFVYHPKENQP
jgi:lipopolysaccharide biosynthesis glycosyltransferase